jgi:hypothetical protein
VDRENRIVEVDDISRYDDGVAVEIWGSACGSRVGFRRLAKTNFEIQLISSDHKPLMIDEDSGMTFSFAAP